MAPVAILATALILPPLLNVFFISVYGWEFSFSAFYDVFSNRLFRLTLSRTLVISLTASVTSLVLGYVLALHLARQPPSRRASLMALVLLPFWTSILVRCFALTVILGRSGIANTFLSWLTGTNIQLPLVLNRFGTIVGMTSYLVPFAVFPILASLLAIDPAVYRAASIMGAKPARIFWTVTLPLSLPGMIAAFLSIFVMSLGTFIIPALLGGPDDQMLSNLVDFYNRQILDWNKAAAISAVLFIMVVIFAAPLPYLRRRRTLRA